MERVVTGEAARRGTRGASLLARTVVGLAALTTLAFGLGLAGWAGAGTVGHVVSPVVAVAAVALCVRAARQPGTPPVARTVWRLTTAGMAFIAASITVRIVAANAQADALAPVHGVLQGIGAVLLALSIVRIPLGLRTRAEKVALALDAATLAVAAAAVAWHVVGDHAEASLTGDTVSAIAPVMGPALMAVLLAAKAAMSGSDVLPRRALVLRAVSALVGGLGSAVGMLLLTVRPDVDAQLLLNPVASATLALSAHLQVVDTACPEARAARRRHYSVLPYVAVAAVAALLVHTSVQGTSDRLVVVAAAVVLTGLVIVRQLVAFRQNDALLTTLGHRELQFRLLVQNSSDIVMITDDAGVILYLSPSITRVLGHDRDALVGRHALEHAHPDDERDARGAVASTVGRPGGTATFPLRMRHADGTWRWLEVVSSNFQHEPTVGGWISNARDITETREIQERLSHQATHDALTGLANRVLFGDRVHRAVESTGPGQRLSLVLVDLDDFKSVNDTLGHAVGDRLLVVVAERMRAAVRAGDTVARLGGDEFAILLAGLDPEAVDSVLDRIVEALREPVDIEGHRLVVRASFGVVEATSGDDPGELLRHADIAMYAAKRRGEGGHARYRPELQAPGSAA